MDKDHFRNCWDSESCINGNESLVVGHKVMKDESDAFDEDAPIYQEESRRNIIRIMNAFRKPTEDIIARNRQFFESLSDITDIYVYGHSYSRVDYDYFVEIRKSVNNDTKWHLGWHNDNDIVAAKDMMTVLKVPEGSWELSKF